jgi:hypothetical protein
MRQQSSSRRTDEAVARATRHWQVRGKAGACRWTIAISRQAGANGPPIAEAVGERLAWPVYNR